MRSSGRRRGRGALVVAYAGASLLACHPPPPRAPEPGVLVAHNSGFGCDGCQVIRRGDRIIALDGRALRPDEALPIRAWAKGQPVTLTIQRPTSFGSFEVFTVEVTARPHGALAPIEGAPPRFTVPQATLERTPVFAQRGLFGQVCPRVMLVGMDGSVVHGRQLYGARHVLVFWDHASAHERAQAGELLRALQRASAALSAGGVDALLVQHSFPRAGPSVRPMDDAQLRQFAREHALSGLPPLTLYRFPNTTEYDPRLELGLQPRSIVEHLRATPAIVVLDARGVIRWHSEGESPDSGGRRSTIEQAHAFALRGR